MERGGKAGGGEERQSHSEYHSVEPILVLPVKSPFLQLVTWDLCI